MIRSPPLAIVHAVPSGKARVRMLEALAGFTRLLFLSL